MLSAARQAICQIRPNTKVLDVTPTMTCTSYHTYIESVRKKQAVVLLVTCNESTIDVFRYLFEKVPFTGGECMILHTDKRLLVKSISDLRTVILSKFLEDAAEDKRCCVCMETKEGHLCHTCAHMTCLECCQSTKTVESVSDIQFEFFWCAVCPHAVLQFAKR